MFVPGAVSEQVVQTRERFSTLITPSNYCHIISDIAQCPTRDNWLCNVRNTINILHASVVIKVTVMVYDVNKRLKVVFNKQEGRVF